MINIISFTRKGLEVAEKVKEVVPARVYSKCQSISETESMNKQVMLVEESIGEWTRKMQRKKDPILFVGAMGIAVRAISGGIEDKLSDAPVLVMDELGQYIIPVLAGHVGGANELAVKIANLLGAIPVITTATDVEGAFAVDLWAKENGLGIYNREGIAKVSAKALEGKAIRLSIENFPPKNTDVVVSSDLTYLHQGKILLCPKTYGVGIGCRKETDSDMLEEFVLRTLMEEGISIHEVGAFASIDLKREEEALVRLGKTYHIPFITFTTELLSKAKGEYEESAFVEKTTGVGNVCERAAMLLTGNSGDIVVKKRAENGMTIAVARIGR